MPVDTGMIPDDQIPVGDQSREEVLPPPSEVAGLAVLQQEASATEEGELEKVVSIRSTQRYDKRPGHEGEALPCPDARFRLREAVPGFLLLDLAEKQGKVQSADSPQTQASLFAALGRSISMLVAEEDRGAFVDHLIETDPPIDIPELVGAEGGILGDMMQRVIGRPTQSASE